MLDIRPRLVLEAWPAAQASSLVLRSRGRLVDDAQRLTSDKDFSTDAALPGLNAFLPVLVVYVVTIVIHNVIQENTRSDGEALVFRVERRLSSSFHDAPFLPLL